MAELMLISFLALISLTLSGFGLTRWMHRLIGYRTNTAIEAGTGFFFAAALTGTALGTGLLPLATASRTLFALSLLASLVVLSFLRDPASRFALSGHGTLSTGWWAERLLLGVLVLYLALVLLNNVSRDIFPWDAFTTWLFRAKAWVLTDSALTFIPQTLWLTGGPSAYTLPASHYPVAVSAISAFTSALGGQWNEQMASLPWFFCSLASALLMTGLCQLQQPSNKVIPVLGGILLSTAPLVHLHGMLAGYADIWVMGTSGMGLAGLCIWTQERSRQVMTTSLLLLFLGCFWKQEGWLWLMVGVAVVHLYWLWLRLDVRSLLILAPLALSVFYFQPFDLGALGTWGFSATELNAGALGRFTLRPYDPTGDYLEMTLVQGNFLLLAPLYAASLAVLASRWRQFGGYLLMASLIAGAHWVIFGLSSYSYYAQTGTAINRLLLQNLPVLVVTITAACHIVQQPFSARNTRVSGLSLRGLWQSLSLAGIAGAFALLLLMAAIKVPPGATPAERAVSVPASTWVAVLGNLSETPRGWQFSGTDVPIGVAAVPMSRTGQVQPRFMLARTWMKAPETIAFYWINTNDPAVHSVPLTASGQALIDMSHYPDFWQKPIREMGFLVQPQHFDTTALGSVTLTDALSDTVPALFNHWTTPAPLSQRLINSTAGHIDTPVTLNAWLGTALAGLGALGFAGLALRRTLFAPSAGAFAGAVAVLWGIGCLTHLNQVYGLTTPLFKEQSMAGTLARANEARADGTHLVGISATLAATQLGQPIVSVGLDAAGRFDAQRLPFMLLPENATSFTEPQFMQVIYGFEGTAVLFAGDPDVLDDTVSALALTSPLTLRQRGDGYAVLSSGRAP